MNEEISKIFYEIAALLDMKEVSFKPRAYEKAALAIKTLEQDIKDIYKKGGLKALMEIPGIGLGIAEKIEEYIKTRHIRDYEQLKKQIPVDVSGLTLLKASGQKAFTVSIKNLALKPLASLKKRPKPEN